MRDDPERDFRGERRLGRRPVAGGLLAAFAYDLVARPPAAEGVVAEPPQGTRGDITGRETP